MPRKKSTPAIHCSMSEFHRLVESNLPLVHHIAKLCMRKIPSYRDYDEAIAVGNLAMVRAARTFRPELGWKFTTYASRAIYRSVFELMNDTLKFRAVQGPLDAESHNGWDHVSRHGRQEDGQMAEKAFDDCEWLKHATRGLERRLVGILAGWGCRRQILADRYRLSKERIRQIQGRGLRILKAIAYSQGLIDAEET